ncbi:hypothetical protein [Streptomyces sp. MAR4 CNX-425]|uniref:hypothetical protein n=1 Tax=Streptomyces sp. MAR4 CNX-425 TaxID=3406343 RepID=UPI003B507D85
MTHTGDGAGAGRDGAPGPALRRRLDALRGADVPPRALDARALAALAANPGCRRRTLLDGAGIDKGALAEALGRPAPFGQSQFAFARGNAFEARITADDGAELLGLLAERTGDPPPDPADVHVPDLAAPGPRGRTERTRLAIAAAVESGGWTLLRHPMVSLEVAGAPVFLEPDAAVIGPDGRCTVAEIKSFPILDGSADPAKVGAAARQAAVYVLALQPHCAVHERVLLVCPKDFSNQPVAEPVDVRKQLAATRRQLARLTRLEAIAAGLPAELSLDVRQPPGRLAAAVESVEAAYAPECLAACELAFHCRARARERGDVTVLGRGVRSELGELRTVSEVVAAAGGPAEPRRDAAEPPRQPTPETGPAKPGPAPEEPAVVALRRAAALRAEALSAAAASGGVGPAAAPGTPAPGAPERDAHGSDATKPRAPGTGAPRAAPEAGGAR